MTIDSERSTAAVRSVEGIDPDIGIGVHEIEGAGLGLRPRVLDGETLVGLPERVLERRHGANEHVVHSAVPEVLGPRVRVAVLPLVSGTRAVRRLIVRPPAAGA